MKLRKKYNFWVILMMAINATLGTSILISFGQVAFQVGFNPLLMVCAWVLGALLVLPEILLLSEGAVSFPGNGSAYYWLKKANWNACSFWLGWILVLMVSATAIAGSCLALGNIIASLLSIENEWLAKSFGIIILLLLTISQIFFKNVASSSQIIFSLLKSFPIVFVLIIAMAYGTNANFQKDVITHNLSAIFLSTYLLLPSTAMTMFAYSGIESITYVSEEIENPKKNIPKALIIATVVVVIVYIVLSIALLTINSPVSWLDNNGDISNVWYYAIMNNPNIPHVFAYIFSGFTILLFIGSLNAFLLYQSRMVFKMSQEKDLFKVFQKTTNKTNMPWTSILLLVVIALIYVVFDELYSVTAYFVLAVSFLKLIVISVIIWLRLKHEEYKPIFNNCTFWFLVVISYFGAILTLIGSLLAMYYYAQQVHNMWKLWNCLIVVGVIFTGYPLYYLKVYVNNLIIKRKSKINSLR